MAFLLSKKLGVGLINQSKNANSMGGIVFNTINHLSDLNSDDTLVVIGLTWPDRKYIFLMIIVNHHQQVIFKVVK